MKHTSRKEFTFLCPVCSQPILAKLEWVGRPMECPSCSTGITVPEPGKARTKKTRITSPPKKSEKLSGGSKPKRLFGFS